MDDLVPFLIFIVIALINLGKFLLEKKFQGDQPPADGSEQEEQPASGLEEFFEELARKLDPNEKPVDLPEWPEGYEKPDYAAEQAAFEEYQEKEERFEPAPAAEIVPMPVMREARPDVSVETVETASLKSAMNAIPAMKSTFAFGMKSAPIMKSGHAGAINFSLKDKAALRKAILAKVVLDPPRAYDESFKNTAL